jgi:hypothetical protein
VDVWEGIAPASSGEPCADPLRNRGETHRIGVHGIARAVAIPAHEKIVRGSHPTTSLDKL